MLPESDPTPTHRLPYTLFYSLPNPTPNRNLPTTSPHPTLPYLTPYLTLPQPYLPNHYSTYPTPP